MAKIELEIPTQRDAYLLAYILGDAANNCKLKAAQWGAKFGDGDAFQARLDAEAKFLDELSKVIGKAMKSLPEIVATE